MIIVKHADIEFTRKQSAVVDVNDGRKGFIPIDRADLGFSFDVVAEVLPQAVKTNVEDG